MNEFRTRGSSQIDGLTQIINHMGGFQIRGSPAKWWGFKFDTTHLKNGVGHMDDFEIER
jgi:hypothetical protein